jgi:hypothetical protein
MGKVFYDMGFLSTAEVVDCSATDLIGQYVGQTGPKTQKLLEKALGKVLFIDEAYRLAEGGFATEAMDELVDCLTKPKFHKKLVTILAGYDEDINRLMAMNPGLTSRFPEAIVFKSLVPEQCAMLMKNLLMKIKKLDSNSVEQAIAQIYEKLLEAFVTLIALPSWGNARDLETLVKVIYGSLLRTATITKDSPKLVLVAEDVLSAMESMINERALRGDASKSRSSLPNGLENIVQKLQRQPLTRDLAPTSYEVSQTSEDPQQSNADEPVSPQAMQEAERDAGVSEGTWQQLQRDRLAAERMESEQQNIMQAEIKFRKKFDEDGVEAELKLQLLERQANEKAEDDVLKRLHEEARLQHERIRRQRSLELAEWEAKAKKAMEEKRREAEAQKKLRQMGVCVAGFRWIKQQGGYRCAGGSHFVSDASLA